mgnify:CR=1 FL=1
MAQTRVLPGHVVGETTVRVDQPIPGDTAEVEVVLHLRKSGKLGSVGEYVRQLPPGERTKEDIDRQIREERDSWRD